MTIVDAGNLLDERGALIPEERRQGGALVTRNARWLLVRHAATVPSSVEPSTTEQVELPVEAVPDRYRALVVLGAGTGVRQGEAFGVSLDRVDFLRRLLTVERQMLVLPGSGPVLAPPKTQASYQTIPLPDVVLETLSAHLATSGAGAEGLVFTNADGEPIRRTRFSSVWRPAAQVAGLEPGIGFTLFGTSTRRFSSGTANR